jgi:Heterokaryon incompatibility protein (HET)
VLCAACEAIFRDVYLLGSNKRIQWAHDFDTFHQARLSGCQVCNFIWVHLPKQLAVTELSRDHFPCQYAFQLLSADWARFGRGPEFLEIEVGGDETEEFAEERAGTALSRHGSDFNVHKLRYLLKKEVQPLLSGEIEIWAVLCFDVGAHQIRLPMQVHRGTTTDSWITDRVLETDITVDEAADELALVRLSEQDTTGSVETLQLGKHWLSECISNHPECKPVYEDSAWHPFRLIDVGTSDCPCLKLTLGSTLPPKTKYATLSHCWGDTQDSVVTRETLTAFFDAIPPDTLSCTARDAVHVARALGLRYLWIDDFCIIQGDKDDWQTQSAQMAKVYGWSTCTIAAASSRSGSETFLRNRNQHAVRPCEVPNPFSTEANMSFQIGARSLSTVFDEEVKATSWHNRGWVFQERLLSQRLLIFGATQMMWSCQRHSAAESWPGGRTSKHHVDRFESFEAEKLELHQLLNPKRSLDTKDQVWESVVQRYAKAEMRKSSDRLVALQGIASRVMDATGRHYAFGLWLDATLAESLLWHVSTDMIGTAQRLHDMPTWSWGSVAVPVEFLHDQTSLAQTYVEINVCRPGAERNIPERGLEILGPLLEMTLVRHTSERYFELRRDDYFEFKRRQSIHQGHLETTSDLPISTEEQTTRRVRRFTALGIKLRATL